MRFIKKKGCDIENLIAANLEAKFSTSYKT